MVFQTQFPKKLLPLMIGWAVMGQDAHGQTEPSSGAVPNEEDEAIEEVHVQGVRASQARSIDIKRNSKNVVDSIVAEDIGKLPDVTITDSLQRITGVQVRREGNEGTSLNVRGMPQVLTTLNGEQFLSPWNITDVGANYSDVPAGMISGVNVYKSQSASMIAGGISGLIDLQTLSPLSLDKGFKYNLKLENSQGTRSNERIQEDGSYKKGPYDYNYSGLFGYNHEGQHAFTLSLASSRSYAANYSMWEDPRFLFLETQNGRPHDPLDINGDGDLSNDWYLGPQNFAASSRFLTRDRNGGSFSLESTLSDTVTFRGDVFYTRMDQYDRGVAIEFENNTGALAWPRDDIPGSESELRNALLPSSGLGESYDLAYGANDGVQNVTIYSVNNPEALASGFQSKSSNEINETAALNSSFQLNYDNDDNLKASMRYVYAKAEKRYRKANLAQGRPGWLWIDTNGEPGKDPIEPYPVGVDYSGDVPRFYFNEAGVTDAALRATGLFQNADGSDIFNYSRDIFDASALANYQAIAEGDNTEATLQVVRADASYSFEDTGVLQSVDFGFRSGVRDAEYTKFFYVTPTQTYEEWDTRFPPELRGQLRPGNAVWQRFPDWENYSDTSALQVSDTIVYSDFGPIQGLENGVAAINPAVWDEPLSFMNRMYPGTKTVTDPAFEYQVREASTSLFAQLNLEGENGLWGMAYSGDIGLRIINTDREVNRNKVPEVLDFFNSIGSVEFQRLAFVYDPETKQRSFTQYLPSLNLNLFPSDSVVVRFGVNKTTTRNDLKNVGSGLSLWYTNCEKIDENGERVTFIDGQGAERGETVTCVGGGEDRGNIDIEPWSATVYNNSIEWYFSEDAILGLGLFYIDVDTSVQEFQQSRNFLDGDGIDRGRAANIWVTENVEASSLQGLEFGYKHPFTFLPSFLASTGVEFNYTYSESDSKAVDLVGNSLPLPSNSEHQSNLILWYDNHGLNVRLAYNWRSEEYLSRKELATGIGDDLALSYWREPVGYLDLSVSYWVNEHLSISANGTNLTEENQRGYAQFEDQFQRLNVQEARYTLGINLNF